MNHLNDFEFRLSKAYEKISVLEAKIAKLRYEAEERRKDSQALWRNLMRAMEDIDKLLKEKLNERTSSNQSQVEDPS